MAENPSPLKRRTVWIAVAVGSGAAIAGLVVAALDPAVRGGHSFGDAARLVTPIGMLIAVAGAVLQRSRSRKHG